MTLTITPLIIRSQIQTLCLWTLLFFHNMIYIKEYFFFGLHSIIVMYEIYRFVKLKRQQKVQLRQEKTAERLDNFVRQYLEDLFDQRELFTSKEYLDQMNLCLTINRLPTEQKCIIYDRMHLILKI